MKPRVGTAAALLPEGEFVVERRCAEAGFTMVAFVVAIAVMSILMTVAVQAVSFQMKREREAELIFRGEQYVEAIRLFKKRHGRYPVKLKELWEAKPPLIRKEWADPMTDSRAWGLIFEGQGGGLPGQRGGLPGQRGGLPGQTGNLPGQPIGGNQQRGNQGGFGARPAPTGTPGVGGRGGGEGSGGPGGTDPATFVVSGEDGEPPKGDSGKPSRTGPIIGVHSTSCEESVRIYEGRNTHCEWQFIYRDRESPRGARGGGTGRPGTRGFHAGDSTTPVARVTGTPRS